MGIIEIERKRFGWLKLTFNPFEIMKTKMIKINVQNEYEGVNFSTWKDIFIQFAKPLASFDFSQKIR